MAFIPIISQSFTYYRQPNIPSQKKEESERWSDLLSPCLITQNNKNYGNLECQNKIRCSLVILA